MKRKNDNHYSILPIKKSEDVIVDEESQGITNNCENIEDYLEHIPDCWTIEQVQFFLNKYNGLIIRNKKLGCALCKKVADLRVYNAKSIHVSSEWQNCRIQPCRSNRKVQQSSLRKKMREHFDSIAHLCVVNLIDESKPTGSSVTNQKLEEINIGNICRVFNMVYSLVKASQPMSHIEDKLELHIKNEITFGNDQFSLIRVIDHISEEMRMQICKKIVEKEAQIRIIVDEVDILEKTTLLIFMECELEGYSPTIFLDLLELESTDADNIYNTFMSTLSHLGFDTDYLTEHLIGYCFDDASTILGLKSGIASTLLQDFPNITTWNCFNNRLELIFDEAIHVLNTLCGDTRAILTIKNITCYMIINLLGKPLHSWDTMIYAESWANSPQCASDNSDLSTRKYDENQVAIWKLQP